MYSFSNSCIMKNLLQTQFLSLFICLFIYTGCKKSDELNPANIADRMTGNYTISLIESNGKSIKLPYNQNGQQINGTITIAKVSPTTISFSYSLVVVNNGVRNVDSETGNLDIKQNGNAIELYESNTLVGNFTNNVLIIDTGDTKITSNKN
jgi:hypothetical protein